MNPLLLKDFEKEINKKFRVDVFGIFHENMSIHYHISHHIFTALHPLVTLSIIKNLFGIYS